MDKRAVALVAIALALAGAVAALVLLLRPSAAATAAPRTLTPAEAARATAAVAESPEDEIFEAEGAEALSVFAGLLTLLDKSAAQGVGTQVVSGIVHDIALGAIAAVGKGTPKAVGSALAAVTVLEMAYQCSALGGDDTSGCASSSTFLALQLGLKWQGVPSALRGWFNAARSTYSIARPDSFGALARFVSDTRAMHAAAKAAASAASRQVVGQTAARVSGAAARIAATAAAQSGGAVASAAARSGVASAVRVAAGTAARAAAVGVSVAGQLASRVVALAGGPVAVAVFAVQIALSAVTAHLDASCVGDFAEHCHASREALVRLTGEGAPMRAVFEQELQRRFGPRVLGTPDLALLQPLSFDPDRMQVARAARRGVMYRRAFNDLARGGGWPFSTMEQWVERLRTMAPMAQFAEIYQVTSRVAADAEALLDVDAPAELCAREPGYALEAGVSVAPCRAGRDACCKRAAAVTSMVRAAHARPSACAAIKFAVSAIGDAGVVADVYEAMEGSAAATAATWAAWDAVAFARTLARWVPNAARPMAYPADVMRVACTLGVVDVLAERRPATSAAEALGALRRAYARGLAAVFGEEGELPADELLLPWPTHRGGDLAWLNTDPMLMGLAVRWVRNGAPGEPPKTDESHEAACAGDGAGRCAPAFAMYANTHVCPHVRAGKDASVAADPRTYGDARVGHGVVWATGECTATTAYCEEYGFHPEPVGGGAECTAEESVKLWASELAYLAKIPLTRNVCGAPNQCERKRAYCSSGAGACECSRQFSSNVLKTLVLGETGAGALKRACGGGFWETPLGAAIGL